MRYQSFLCVLPMLGGLALGGCATVTRGTTSEVEFLSEPAGATVTASQGATCTTPCKLTFPRKEEFAAVFRLAGFKDVTVEVKSMVAGAGVAGLAGNVLIGGAVGIGVDAISGATLEHVPNPVSVVMERVGPAPKARPGVRPVDPPRAKPEPPPEAAVPVPAPPSPPIKEQYRPGRPDRIL